MRVSWTTPCIAGALAASLMCLSASAVTVTVNPAKQYQAILGFGCHGGGNPATLVSDLGLSAHRDEIVGGTNSGAGWSYMKQLADAGVKTFFATPWSPPANLKSNNSLNNGGSLLPANYSTFAGMLVQYAKNQKSNVGVDLTFMSPQNEPAFPESYQSCVYDTGTYKAFVRVLGPALANAGLPTKISVAEDMLVSFVATPYASKAIRDTAPGGGGKYIGMISVHGYSDGVLPSSGRKGIGTWRIVSNFATQMKKLTAQTEISGYKDSWENGSMTTWDGTLNPDAPGGLALGSDILIALKYGHVSLWCYWRCAGQLYYSVTDNGVYEASKQFYKFIRPDAINVESVQDVADTNVLDVAFWHKANKTLTVVFVNLARTTKSVTLAGTSIPASFAGYRSSASEKCVSTGTVAKDNISLPAHSITTLVGSNYSPTVAVAGDRRSLGANAGTPIARASRVAAFGLDGRRMAADAVQSSRGAMGVRCLVAEDQSGRSVARRVLPR